MAELMQQASRTRALWARMRDRERWAAAADGLAVALAVSLPWSSSATAILAGLLLIAIIPTLDRSALRRVLSTPAGGLPVLFWLLGLVGMLWAAGVPMAERWDGLKSFYKLLFIPLLIVQFSRSDRAPWVMTGFLASSVVLMALSWALLLLPGVTFPWHGHGPTGVPVKDYIAQSAEFTFCTFILAAIAVDAWRGQRRWIALALSLLALLFLANIFYASVSRTALVVIPILVLLFAYKKLSGAGAIGVLLAAVLLSALTWSFAPKVGRNITDLWSEVYEFRPESASTRAGERLEFWRKSIGFVVKAPLIGHGTGSIRTQFRESIVRQTGMAALASANPHNQTLAVAIQLGFVGTAALFAMWLAHLLIFRGTGLAAWAGLLVVSQNIVGSLFNSHLFDFTQGWGYVIGVGVAGGVALKHIVGSQQAKAAAGNEALPSGTAGGESIA